MRSFLSLLWLLIGINLLWIGTMTVEGVAKEPEIRVKLVEIRGNHRIEASTIRAKIKLREGDLFTPEVIEQDIKSIYQLGYFDDVQVESKDFEGGVKIIYTVLERPFITEILFDGNEDLATEKLEEKITLKVQSFLNQQQMKQDVEKLKQYYQEEGYSNARIVPVIKVLGEDRAGLTFYIKEGERIRVREIRFEGNNAFPPKRLKSVISTKEYSWLTSWLTESGRFKQDELATDVEQLRDFYLNSGYLEVQVGEPRTEMNKKHTGFILTFPIFEGGQYTIQSIRFQGNKVFSDTELRKEIKSVEGELFRRNILRQDIAVLTDAYGEKGYAFANVIPQIQPETGAGRVAITFDISEEKQVRVRQINILGNEKTRDKVIRREIRLDEQEVINTKALRRSFQRLNNLNFFDTVELLPEEVSSDQMDLNVRVKEKSTGSFSIGGGYSSLDRVVGLLELTQGNLFGRAQLLRTKAEFGRRRNTYSLTFREPYLLDYPISGTFDLFREDRDFTSYKEKRLGGDVILGKSFTEYVNGSVSYTYENVRLFDITSTSPTIRDQEGRQTTSSVGMSLAYDSRDNFLDTHEGMRHSISLEVAGSYLGGTNSFIKLTGDSSKFFPLWWNTVFSVHSRIGYATGIDGRQLPLGERFYVGGINTVRGFDFGKAGPRDQDGVGEIIGGDQELFFNLEYLIPLVPEANIKGVLFFDAGRAYDSNLIYSESIADLRLRYSAGLGIRWISPVGPLRLEWGFNLNPRQNEKSKTLEFSIGTLF